MSLPSAQRARATEVLTLTLTLTLTLPQTLTHHSQEAEVRDPTVLTLHCARVKGVAVHIQVVSAAERVNLPCTRGAGASAASGAARRAARAESTGRSSAHGGRTFPLPRANER